MLPALSIEAGFGFGSSEEAESPECSSMGSSSILHQKTSLHTRITNWDDFVLTARGPVRKLGELIYGIGITI